MKNLASEVTAHMHVVHMALFAASTLMTDCCLMTLMHTFLLKICGSRFGTGEALQLGPDNIVKVTSVADKWNCKAQRTRCISWLKDNLANLG